jgi:hypothetical protein
MRLGFSQTQNDSVATPPYLYDLLDKEFKFDFDPCPFNPEFKEGKDNGLTKDWGTSTFVNPPYSKIEPWVKKAVEWCKTGENRTVVLLVPYRGTTKYWREYIFPYHSKLRLLTKQIVFVGYSKNFPIPLVIVVFTSESCQKKLREETVINTGIIIKKRTKAQVRYYEL